MVRTQEQGEMRWVEGRKDEGEAVGFRHNFQGTKEQKLCVNDGGGWMLWFLLVLDICDSNWTNTSPCVEAQYGATSKVIAAEF